MPPFQGFDEDNTGCLMAILMSALLVCTSQKCEALKVGYYTVNACTVSPKPVLTFLLLISGILAPALN